MLLLLAVANCMRRVNFSEHLWCVNLRILCIYHTDPPKVSLHPPGPKHTVNVGTRLFLYCIARGLPAPTIQWYENNVLIPQQSSPLYLAPIDTPKVTMYTCEAKNNAGNRENTVRKSITVTVKSMYIHICDRICKT